jgi:hypothetical protein
VYIYDNAVRIDHHDISLSCTLIHGKCTAMGRTIQRKVADESLVFDMKKSGSVPGFGEGEQLYAVGNIVRCD